MKTKDQNRMKNLPVPKTSFSSLPSVRSRSVLFVPLRLIPGPVVRGLAAPCPATDILCPPIQVKTEIKKSENRRPESNEKSRRPQNSVRSCSPKSRSKFKVQRSKFKVLPVRLRNSVLSVPSCSPCCFSGVLPLCSPSKFKVPRVRSYAPNAPRLLRAAPPDRSPLTADLGPAEPGNR
jgi:hypothetical protein